VLPILHLNGYKIANPTVLARIEPEELDQFLRGNGWTPYYVEGDEPALMHEAMAETLDQALEQIKRIQHEARVNGNTMRPRWPMIVLKSPKGWTGPKWVDGLQIEGLSAPIRCRWPWMPAIPNISSCWKTGCEVTGRRNSSMSKAA